jgi:hypothetical protein
MQKSTILVILTPKTPPKCVKIPKKNPKLPHFQRYDAIYARLVPPLSRALAASLLGTEGDLGAFWLGVPRGELPVGEWVAVAGWQLVDIRMQQLMAVILVLI